MVGERLIRFHPSHYESWLYIPQLYVRVKNGFVSGVTNVDPDVVMRNVMILFSTNPEFLLAYGVVKDYRLVAHLLSWVEQAFFPNYCIYVYELSIDEKLSKDIREEFKSRFLADIENVSKIISSSGGRLNKLRFITKRNPEAFKRYLRSIFNGADITTYTAFEIGLGGL